ncbi:MAG: methionyl-tRNA formyltransferase [Akkermansiaceae bacterium]|nr:methionyl-tRNA formyltransferase [Akkermansiaceae bacterium]
MRVVFMGTGEIGVPCLDALLASSHDIVGLVTQPDRPVGRHQELTPPRVKSIARDAGVPVLQPERVRRKDAVEEIRALAPDVIVVVAYGQLLPPDLLAIPPKGCLNVHASLLPRHRGASCIQAAIAAGDEESGVTIMFMAKGLDTGDVILRQATALAPGETGGSLHDRLAALAPPALMDALRRLEAGTARPEPQDGALATYAPKLRREDGELDWSAGASALERRIRAYDPWPGTYTWFRDARGRERRLKVFPAVEVAAGSGPPGTILEAGAAGLVVACGDGGLRVHALQPDGAKRMGAAEFLTGHETVPREGFFSLAKGRG